MRTKLCSFLALLSSIKILDHNRFLLYSVNFTVVKPSTSLLGRKLKGLLRRRVVRAVAFSRRGLQRGKEPIIQLHFVEYI